MAPRGLVASGLSLLLLAGAANADILRLDEALRLAVTQHPSVAMRVSQRDAAAQALDAAGRGRFPALSAQTGKEATGKDFVTLRVEQLLWSGGRLSGEVSGADATLRSAAAAVQESQQEIMLRAASAYTELGRFEASKSAARANVAEHERLQRMIGNRINSQITSSSDGLLAHARLSQSRAELSQLEAQGARARARLGEIVGQVVAEIEPAPSPRLRPASLAAAVDAATAFSPVLRRLSAQEDVGEAEIQVRRGQALPQVKLRYDRTQGGYQQGSQAYVMLEYQSGAGLASLSMIRESEARRQAVRAERLSALRDAVDAVSADWADLQSLEAQARDLRSQVAATAQVFESFVRQYAVGRKNWIEVLNAQRELTQARYALTDAEWGSLRVALKLQLATGQLNASTFPGTPRTAQND
ncbi:MAG: TolC family protein [Polaromonas sp.]|nr:TolC family protein [Polaromonas sp.]